MNEINFYPQKRDVIYKSRLKTSTILLDIV